MTLVIVAPLSIEVRSKLSVKKGHEQAEVVYKCINTMSIALARRTRDLKTGRKARNKLVIHV